MTHLILPVETQSHYLSNKNSTCVIGTLILTTTRIKIIVVITLTILVRLLLLFRDQVIFHHRLNRMCGILQN